MHRWFCAVLAVASSVTAYERILKEKIVPPHGWSRVGSPPADHVIKLQIGLEQSNFGMLEQHLLQVSDPQHSRYGKYLSKEEVESYIRPHDDALTAVDEWLQSHGIDVEHNISRSDALDWVFVDAPVGLAEKLLNTTYSVWRHPSGQNIVRTTQYHLPQTLYRHIDVIQPTTSFSLFKPSKVSYAPEVVEHSPNLVETEGKVLAANGNWVNISCNSTITPSCLYDLYGVHYNGSSLTKNSIGTTGYLENYFNLTDLNAFYEAYVPAALGTPVDIIEISGGINDQGVLRAEAELDTQYAFGLAHPAANTFYTMGGRPPFHIDNFTVINSNEPYQDWINYLLSRKQKDLPLIISTSYGDDEQTVPRSYAKRVCAGLAQLGARGISLLFSTGDFGVGDGETDPSKTVCLTNDGHNRTRFLPTFPATCPYVTAVGGTVLIDEEGVDFSGGGFSDYFSRPHYQELAVAQAKKHIPKGTYAGLYNPAGRAFPDISAQSVAYWINIGGSFVRISGTSASTPALAGIFAKINDMRLKAHLPSLGFLNPLLYRLDQSMPSLPNLTVYYSRLGFGVYDITKGNNPVSCGTPGFNATPGYDLVTGLGTPNFPELTRLAMGKL